jgi:hypothetical protein
MDTKKLTPEQRARAAQERKTEGEKALAEYRAREAAINKNTERLRALRLARDAQNPPPQPATKVKPAARTKKQAASLSDYLKRENDAGRKT